MLRQLGTIPGARQNYLTGAHMSLNRHYLYQASQLVYYVPSQHYQSKPSDSL